LLLLCLLQEPDLLYKTREEQSQLLQQVLAASDMDADEERIPGEGPRIGPNVSVPEHSYCLQCGFCKCCLSILAIKTLNLAVISPHRKCAYSCPLHQSNCHNLAHKV